VQPILFSLNSLETGSIINLADREESIMEETYDEAFTGTQFDKSMFEIKIDVIFFEKDVRELLRRNFSINVGGRKRAHELPLVLSIKDFNTLIKGVLFLLGLRFIDKDIVDEMLKCIMLNSNLKSN
jgi:hypothetical protein